MWFEISRKLGLDKAVADLDACLSPDLQRALDADSDVVEQYRKALSEEPPRTAKVLHPLIKEADAAGVPAKARERAAWLAKNLQPGSGHASRLQKVIQVCRGVGLWIHAQGTLEDVLGISEKSVHAARAAAAASGPVDAVASWCAYQLDTAGDVLVMLNELVERVAHGLMEAERVDPGARSTAPTGANATAVGRLVSVEPLSAGFYRLTVSAPAKYAGYWLEFSRSTPSDQLQLRPPDGEPPPKALQPVD